MKKTLTQMSESEQWQDQNNIVPKYNLNRTENQIRSDQIYSDKIGFKELAQHTSLQLAKALNLLE